MTKAGSYFIFLLLLVSTSLHAQNVGIGTTAPVNKLSVNGKVDIRDSLGIGTTNPVGQLHVKTLAYTALDQQQNLYNFISGSLVFWQSFTAGTTGLLAKVDLLVNSPISSQTSPGTIKIFSGEGNGGTLLSTTNVTFQPVSNTFQSLTLTNTPALVAGNVYTIEFSTPSSNTSWAYSSSGNPYPSGRANLDADQDFAFKTYITSPASDALLVVDGKVGINTTSPVKELDVAGTTKTINLQITNGAANGSILKSDATGNVSWSPISTIETDPKIGTLTPSKIPKWSGTVLSDGLLFDNGVNVGIGTNEPSNKLSVNGKMDIRDSLGINTTNPIGELHVKSKATNTAIDQQQIAANIAVGSTLQWQSFTAGITGLLTRVDLQVSSPISGASAGTIKIFSGEGNGGTLLSTTNVTFQSVNNTFQTFPLSYSPNVVAGNLYTIEFSVPSMNRNWVYLRTGNLYTGGRSDININEDYVFKTYVTKVSDALLVMDGKIGINNTSPAKDLDVAGTIKTTNLQITNGAANGFILKSDALGNATWGSNNNFIETDPKVGTLSTNKIPKWNGTTLADGVLFDNGVNVGIGTTSPTSKLEVNGTVKSQGFHSRQGVNGIPTNNIHNFYWTSTQLEAWVDNVNVGRVLIDNGGNLGIGTITPTTTLDVDGGIRTKYSGTVVFDVVGGVVRSLSIPIPAVPGDWNINNTIVIVTNADGIDGIVRQARLSSLTNIDLKYYQDANGPVRFNWIIFRM